MYLTLEQILKDVWNYQNMFCHYDQFMWKLNRWGRVQLFYSFCYFSLFKRTSWKEKFFFEENFLKREVLLWSELLEERSSSLKRTSWREKFFFQENYSSLSKCVWHKFMHHLEQISIQHWDLWFNHLKENFVKLRFQLFKMVQLTKAALTSIPIRFYWSIMDLYWMKNCIRKNI